MRGLTAALLAAALFAAPALAAPVPVVAGVVNGTITEPYSTNAQQPLSSALEVSRDGAAVKWKFTSDDGTFQFQNHSANAARAEVNAAGTAALVIGQVKEASSPSTPLIALVLWVKGSNWAPGYPDYILIRVKTPGGVLTYDREGWAAPLVGTAFGPASGGATIFP